MSRKTGKPAPAAVRADRGGIDRPQLMRLAALVVVVLAIGVFTGWLVGKPTESQAALTAAQQAETQRDAQLVEELTSTARTTRQLITPIITGLAAPTPPDPAQLEAWKQVMLQETQRFSQTVSAGTATNVARGALRSAVTALANALEAYTLARALSGGQQAQLHELAAKQRVLAVTTWSVAATQLDHLNVQFGHGHQHVYLTTSPDGGAMTPDGSPEGTG